MQWQDTFQNLYGRFILQDAACGWRDANDQKLFVTCTRCPCWGEILQSLLFWLKQTTALIRLKKKNSVSQSCRPHLFFCAHLILQNSDFHFFFLEIIFFFIFTTKNEESLLFWKNLSMWELKKCVKSRLISENTEVETFQSFLVSDVRGGKGQLK